MKKQVLYRDKLEEQIDPPGVKVSKTREGHVVERYSVDGNPRFFVTLAGAHYCAHGNTIAAAITDALWKDPAKRPSAEALAAEIRTSGKRRKITLPEFRVLTGACAEGCRVAIERAKIKETSMTAFDIRDKINRDWGNKLLEILKWTDSK
jgi:hypothetical protein